MIHPHGNISASVTCSDFARFQDLVELVHCMAVAHVFCIVHLCHMKQHLRFYFGLTTSQIYSHSSAEKLCCHLMNLSDYFRMKNLSDLKSEFCRRNSVAT
ncbi:hypothetical protein BDA96_02G301100 [Sorghum bicolor]|uniref:Uncharacterized protein n=1 Tax=Sorghum bicolor TaxID=4558 RepID=A0A921RSL3_SORBI|nr:hypothetical protein BDA96_02G301100 [Sorghum bicolor]